MKIYTIQTSDDGLFNYVATSDKMLLKLIEKTTYKPEFIEYSDRINLQRKFVEFNNTNLKLAIKQNSNKNQYYVTLYILCENDSKLTISELDILK
jgi:hypothetical protein